jgi:hypothetical protein
MQPSRKREGKPAGEHAGNTAGMQLSAKAEGNSVGEGAREPGSTVGPSRKREGKPGGQGWGLVVLGRFALFSRGSESAGIFIAADAPQGQSVHALNGTVG